MKFTVIEKMKSEFSPYERVEMREVEAEDEQAAVAKAVEKYMESSMDFVNLHSSITLIPVIKTIELIPLIKAAQKKMKDQEKKS